MNTELIMSNNCTVQDILELWNLGYTFNINDGRISGIEYPQWIK